MEVGYLPVDMTGNYVKLKCWLYPEQTPVQPFDPPKSTANTRESHKNSPLVSPPYM